MKDLISKNTLIITRLQCLRPPQSHLSSTTNSKTNRNTDGGENEKLAPLMERRGTPVGTFRSCSAKHGVVASFTLLSFSNCGLLGTLFQDAAMGSVRSRRDLDRAKGIRWYKSAVSRKYCNNNSKWTLTTSREVAWQFAEEIDDLVRFRERG